MLMNGITAYRWSWRGWVVVGTDFMLLAFLPFVTRIAIVFPFGP